jgi:outer membrane protein W
MVDIHSARRWPGTLVAAVTFMMTPAPVVRKVSKVSRATYAATTANALTPINNTGVLPATILLCWYPALLC